MLLIGLLLVALVCLALGLVLASACWLIGSLVATAAAAYAMWARRDELAAPAAAKQPAAGPPAAVRPAGERPERDAHDEAEVDTEYQQRRAAWFAEGTAAGDVWVIDGRPDYHAPGCARLVGERAEPVPHTQASEDGFTSCTLCDPDSTVPASPGAATAAAGDPDPEHGGQVWVVDGRPRYHRRDCMIIKDQQAEPIPSEQATEDGFMPCSLCDPNALASGGPTSDRPAP
ncbi:MAG: hypothetical protein ACRDWT_17365 [Jatrophihabitantaceae bacterium]